VTLQQRGGASNILSIPHYRKHTDDLSWRFQSCLEDFTPDVEHYSIDEVFVKMPMSSWHTLTETGRDMKNQVGRSVEF